MSSIGWAMNPRMDRSQEIEDDLYSLASTSTCAKTERHYSVSEFADFVRRLKEVDDNFLDCYNSFVEWREAKLQRYKVQYCRDIEKIILHSLVLIEELNRYLNIFPQLNTPLYQEYVDLCREENWYINYATELPKIKHNIFEQEVTWYTENLPKLAEIAQKEKRPLFIKPIADQDPREAHHTRIVIDHALEQLEKIAPKMKEAPSLESLQNLQKDVERYGWCLTGMAPLLPIEEQNPFQEGGLYQRWQKARLKIQEAESLWHENHESENAIQPKISQKS